MEKNLARINWSRGQYSDVLRSAIIDPSPIKSGQQVKVIWGKGKKQYTAILGCYPVQPEPFQPELSELSPHKSRTKRRLVSYYFWKRKAVVEKPLVDYIASFLLTQLVDLTLQIPFSPDTTAVKVAKVSKSKAKVSTKIAKVSTEKGKKKEKPKGKVCSSV